MNHVFHRDPRGALPTAVRGEGSYIIDDQGKRYLDASGGAAVSVLGHSNAAVVAAIKAQLDEIPYAHSSFFTTTVMEALADDLIVHAPAGLERVYFLSGGSEAMEAALKMARQYFLETGRPERSLFIARRQSYHGNTLGALGVGGNQWRRRPFEPLLRSAHLVSPCFEYRERREGESREAFAERLGSELEAAIEELGPDRVAGFVAETVVGATAGAVPPVPGYFARVREVCDRYGVLLIMDEVMCGMGRTGTLYACEQEGVSPDLLTIAKGLGSGYQPIGALLTSAAVFDAIHSGSGFFQHGHTYMGHPTACAAALATQREIRERGLLANVRARGAELSAALEARFGKHPHVGDLRGRGLFQAVELVRDKASKAPFEPGLGLHRRIRARAMERGLMCYPMGGTIDGQSGDHVLLAPPFIIETAQVQEIVERLGGALDAALADCG